MVVLLSRVGVTPRPVCCSADIVAHCSGPQYSGATVLLVCQMTAICFAFLHILLVLVPWGERLRLFWLLRAAEPQCTANHRTDRALAPLASAPPAAASGRSAGSPDAAHSADGSGGSGSPTAAIRRSSVTVNHAREFELHGSDSESDSSDAGGSGSDSDNSDESSCMEDAEGAEVCWTHLGFMKKLQLVELWLIMPLLGDCFIIWSASQQLSFSAVGRLVRKDAVFLGWASALYWVSLVQHLERSPSFYIVIITLKRASPKVSKLLLGVAPLFLAFSTLGMCVGQRVVVVVVVVVVRVWLCGCVVVCVCVCACACACGCGCAVDVTFLLTCLACAGAGTCLGRLPTGFPRGLGRSSRCLRW